MGSEQMERARAMMAGLIGDMDDLTADVWDYICYVWLRSAREPGDNVGFSCSEFYALRGTKAKPGGSGRRGGYSAAQRREFARQVEILSNVWIQLRDVEVMVDEVDRKGNRRTRRVRKTLSSSALVLDGECSGPAGLRGRPGDAFTPCLMAPNRQTALLSTAVLAYDPSRHKVEKRLGRYFCWQFRIRQSGKSYGDPYRVRTLLEASGQRIATNDPARTKRRFEDALGRLLNDGVISSWCYERSDESIVGARGWSEQWLEWTVRVEPASTVAEYYEKSIRSSAAGDAKGCRPPSNDEIPVPEVGSRLRQVREARGLSQSEAAAQIGIGQGCLSRLESGARRPGRDTMKKLLEWLSDSHAGETVCHGETSAQGLQVA